MFASLNQMRFQTTSRRDDLIQLFYFLVYLFKQGALPGIDAAGDININEEF